MVLTLISLSVGLGSGASSVLSRAIGRAGESAQAEALQQQIVGGALLLTTVLALLIGGAGILAIEPLLALLGAEGERLADGVAYMRVWFAGSIFLFVPVVASGLLRASGHGVSPALLMAATAVATLGSSQVAAFGLAARIQDFAVVPLLAGEWLLGGFTDADEVTRDGLVYLSIVPISYVGYGITIATGAAMNGLGRSATSLPLSGGRAMLGLVPAAWLGVMFAGFNGLALGTLAANLAAGAVALALIRFPPLTARGSPPARRGAVTSAHPAGAAPGRTATGPAK